MFLLDTNVVSELRKVSAGKADPGVAAWARKTPLAFMCMSVVSLQELEIGVLLAERRDPPKGKLLRQWLDGSVVPAFHGRLIAVSADVAIEAAALHVPDPAPVRDALIGATALVHGMTVVTRNTTDFVRFDGLEVLDPWE
jgi:toxin FitB